MRFGTEGENIFRNCEATKTICDVSFVCFWEVIYMWCTSFNWEKKPNVPCEYQTLKLALFPNANTQYPEEQNVTNRSGIDLNVAM